MTGNYLLICSLKIRIYESRYIEIFIDFDVIDIKYVTYVSDQLTVLNLICRQLRCCYLLQKESNK